MRVDEMDHSDANDGKNANKMNDLYESPEHIYEEIKEEDEEEEVTPYVIPPPTKSNWRQKLKCILIIVICIISTLAWLYIMVDEKHFKNFLTYAAKEGAFNPTVFRIFDKSYKGHSNKLIVVEPFKWVIWNINRKLYVLNGEQGFKCSNDSGPAVRIMSRDKYINVCLKLNIDSIVHMYMTECIERVVPYVLEKNKFTIFSALNILCKTEIDFEVIEDDDLFIDDHMRERRRFKSNLHFNMVSLSGGGDDVKSSNTMMKRLNNLFNTKKKANTTNISLNDDISENDGHLEDTRKFSFNKIHKSSSVLKHLSEKSLHNLLRKHKP